MSKHRLSFDQYQALDAVNMSTLLEIGVSPKHYRHLLANKPKETLAMRVGKAAHTAILEPMQFLREYVLTPAEFPNAKGEMRPTNGNLKAYKDWRDGQHADGKAVLSNDEYELAERMQDAVRTHRVASQLLRHGEREVSLRWTDPETMTPCKCRVDWLSADVVDVKTTRHPTPFAFGRQAGQLNYHTRLAWYHDGVKLALGEPAEMPRGVFIIAVQNVEPHDVVVYTLPPDVLEAGRKRYRRLLEQLRDCRESNYWPGVAEDEVLPLQLPLWDLDGGNAGLGLTMGGEAISLD